jgi:protein TonB
LGSAPLNVSAVQVLKKVTPAYPAIARRRKEEGTVTLLAQVKDGFVENVTTERGSGFNTLDANARSALKQWRFSSGLTATVRVPFTFKLTN